MSKRFFNLASMVLQYLIPFTVITYSYTKVWLILSNRTRPGKTKEKEQLELKRKKRTNRMLIAMVIIFAGCWMPLNCVHLIMEFNINFTKQSYFSNVFFIAHVIAMSSTIYNPFLYAWLNDNFRKEFRLILPWIFRAIKWSSKSDPMENINEEESNIEFSKYVVNHGNDQIEMTTVNGKQDSVSKKNLKYEISLNSNKQTTKASKSKDKLDEQMQNGTLDHLLEKEEF